MDTGNADILTRNPVPRHRLTVEDYHRLGEVGILGNEDRVELLDGQLVDMSPIGPRHALAVDALNELLLMAVAGRAGVRVQNPIELDGRTEMHPDIAVVTRPWRGYPNAHPRPGDIVLLIEVADTSLETDRGAKLPGLRLALMHHPLEMLAATGLCAAFCCTAILARRTNKILQAGV